MALVLVGVGYYVIGDITSDTEERISQDSMQELNDRISEVSGSPTDATTAFEFPQGTDEIAADNEAGSVEIMVESSRLHADYLKGPTIEEQTSFELGTIRLEGEGDTVYALQGGGQWEISDGVASASSPPPFNYNGESLRLGFTSLETPGSLTPGTEATVSSESDASIEASDELATALEQVWTVQPEGLEAVGSDLVDVTIEIESEFAEGWATYAENEMDEEPSLVSYYEENSTVVIEFESVGTVLPQDVTSSPDDWENDNILYSGNSSHAVFNEVIEPVGSSFVINQSATSEYDHAVDLTEGDKQVYIAIPNPDHPELDAGATYDGTTWETTEPGEDFTVEANHLRNYSLENQLIPAYREITTVEQYAFTHEDLDSDDLFAYDDDIFKYELADVQEICIFVAEDFPGEGEPQPPGNAYGLADYGPDTETYEQCGMSDVPRESPELEITSVEPTDGEWEELDPIDEDDIEPVDVEVAVTNNGGMGDASVLLEAQIPTATSETDFIPVDEATIANINRTESTVVELAWEPDSSELADINISDELDGESDIRANTGADENVGGDVAVFYDPPPSEHFELLGEEAEVTVSGENASKVDSVDTVQDDVTVAIPVNNTGETAGEQTVALWYDDGSGPSLAATEATELDVGEKQTVTFEWGMDNLGFDIEEISVSVTTDDSQEILQQLDDLLSADFGVSIPEGDLEVLEGQSIEVPVDVENRGAAQDEQEIELIAPDISELASTTVNLSGNEEVSTSIELETSVGDASDSVEIDVSSEERMVTDSMTIHLEPEIKDPLVDNHDRETIPSDWHHDAAEDDGLDSEVESIVDYEGDWWIEEFEFKWGEESCGWFCTDYYIDALKISFDYDVDDAAGVLDSEEPYNELYSIDYSVTGVGQEIGEFSYEDEPPIDDGEVRKALNDGATDNSVELPERIDASTGDNYFPIEITLEIIDDSGEQVDSDVIVIPMGTADDDGEISGTN